MHLRQVCMSIIYPLCLSLNVYGFLLNPYVPKSFDQVIALLHFRYLYYNKFHGQLKLLSLHLYSLTEILNIRHLQEMLRKILKQKSLYISHQIHSTWSGLEEQTHMSGNPFSYWIFTSQIQQNLCDITFWNRLLHIYWYIFHIY